MTTSAALRRLRSTLMGLRGPSRTPAHRSRVDIGSTRPVRRSTPCGCSINAPSLSRSFGRPSLDFRSSSEFDHRDPVPSRRFPSRSDDTSSPDLSLPYDTISGRQLRFFDRGSLHDHEPRAGFGYPLRDIHYQPSRCLRIGASMGFTLQGVPLVTISSPLGGRTLLSLPDALRSPEGKHSQASRLQGLDPVTSPCCRQNHRGSSRRSLPGFHPSRACSHPTWRSLSSWRFPSRPQAALRLDPPGPQGIAVRMSRSVRLRMTSSLGVLYLPTVRRSVHRSSGRAYCFASRRVLRNAGLRSMPLGYDATAEPGSAARRQRHSVYGC